MNPIQTVDYIRILPELVLTAFGIIVMMADPLLKPGASRKGLGLVALGGTIAAIAALEDLVVVTRDTAEFIAAGVPVFNPWSGTLAARGTETVLNAPVEIDALRALVFGKSGDR